MRPFTIGPAHRGASDRQRRHTSVKPRGARIRLAEEHPASVEGRTIFPTRVFHASVLPRLLKSGVNSRKTGSRVMKKKWRGMPIFTLTLEERATCPRNCLEWSTCYGNNMQFAERIIADETFEDTLWGELWELNGLEPDGFVVRLHILGDFYSADYVELWAHALVQFPALRVFGYTARSPFDPIGQAIFRLATQHWDRFAVRFSGLGFGTLTAEVVDSADQASGIICPAQTGKTECCATCALCWSTDAKISFLRH